MGFGVNSKFHGSFSISIPLTAQRIAPRLEKFIIVRPCTVVVIVVAPLADRGCLGILLGEGLVRGFERISVGSL
jgi:hypothetical protein